MERPPFRSSGNFKGSTRINVLDGPAVEIESIGNEKFDVKKAWSRYLEFGGEALSCGTCLEIRQLGASESCPVSTMDELVRLTEQSDKTLVFG
jgi:hypothetical protein